MREWLKQFADHRLLSELSAQKATNMKLHARLRDEQINSLESRRALKRQKEKARVARRELDLHERGIQWQWTKSQNTPGGTDEHEAQRAQGAHQEQLPEEGQRRAMRGTDG